MGVEPSQRKGEPTDDREATVRTDDPDALIAKHFAQARVFRTNGENARAFTELIHASRVVPMTRRLASHVVFTALRAGTGSAAVTLLNSGIQENEGPIRIHIRRQLARMLRHVGLFDLALEALAVLLAEKPGDRRARTVLNALLEREGRWEELDASLEKETKEALRRHSPCAAARASLQRGRIWDERLKNPAHAALRFGQAASYFEQGQDWEGCFDLRLLWVRALTQSGAPPAQMQEPISLLREVAKRLGKDERAEAFIQKLGLDASPRTARRTTERELLASADEAEAKGKRPEAAALLTAALAESPDPDVQKRLETHYVGLGAWRRLAQFYADQVALTKETTTKVDFLGKMAELLEDELNDPQGAAKAYGEIVQLTGDSKALEEQVRLLSVKSDASAVRRALDLAVEGASHDRARADALTARAEAALGAGDAGRAREDLAEAIRLSPGNLRACASMLEASEDPVARAHSAQLLRFALSEMLPGQTGRADLLRRLGRAALHPIADDDLATWAWSELATEDSKDLEPLEQLLMLARRSANRTRLEAALRTYLEQQPRGPSSQTARMELVALLESSGRLDEAFDCLRQAVAVEPSHKEAWAALFKRYSVSGQMEEAAWSLEQVASATENANARCEVWRQLADFARQKLGDEERAALYRARADNVQQLISNDAAPVEPVSTAALTEEYSASLLPPYTEGKERRTELERRRLYGAVQERPLSPVAYRDLAHYFAENDNAERSGLLLEIAEALEPGDSPEVACPQLLMTPADRLVLKHPLLRGDLGEFLFAIGEGFCARFGESRPGGKPFDITSGRGAKATHDALAAAVRILGLRAPEVFVSGQRGPPFSLTYGEGARLWVGGAALKRQVPDEELRFFAGRALFATTPDLLALRTLDADALTEGLVQLGEALDSGQARGWAFLEALDSAAREQLSTLFRQNAAGIDFKTLAMAARHSSNRAGLIVCGGVGPAIRALRAKKALELELAELIRFAASEGYLHLRQRRL